MDVCNPSILVAALELFVLIVPCTLVILEAIEELLLVTVDVKVVILDASEDELFTIVLLVVVIDAAIEELFRFIELCNPSILVAALELLVVIVLFMVTTDETSDADVVLKEELTANKVDAADELNVTKAPRTSVIEAAKEALSKEPVPAACAEITSSLPANEEEESVNVLFTMFIDAAKEALLFITALVRLLIAVAADELLVVTVPLILVIEELKDADAP